MIGFRAQSRGKQHEKRAFWAAALVCLALLALLAVVQVAHVHPLDSSADQCPLCIVMHSAAPVALAAVAIILVQMGAPAVAVESRAGFRRRHSRLFTRPPPAGCLG